MFGISVDGIRGRAFRERWNDLKRIKQDKTSVSAALRPAEIVGERRNSRARLRSFGRVAAQAERIIDKLEVKDPDSMLELGNFAEVSIKTEKVGARAYGFAGGLGK
jgi:hypothetical protein